MTDDFDLEGLRVTEEICADRIARLACRENVPAVLTNAPSTTDLAESQGMDRFTQAEIALASFFADPRYQQIRPLLEQIAPGAPAAIGAIVRKVRVSVWRDFSNPEGEA